MIGLNERGTSVEGLLRLLATATSLKVFFKHPRQTFHPKLYWFEGGATDATTAIIGSPNLTRGGLFTNFETAVIAEINSVAPSADERAFEENLRSIWDALISSPYAYDVEDEDDVRSLLEDGYLSSEARQRRERRRRGRSEEPRAGLPTAPPPPIPAAPFDAIAVPFPVAAPPEEPQEEEVPEPPEDDQDPAGAPPLPDRFYVRTLTENDSSKLVLGAVGTFEPDIGETARDRYPAFWGWPDEYETVTRQLPRDEWPARGRLFSSEAPAGVDVEVMLWFRPERPGHAAEHRLRLGPIGAVRAATPPHFDTDSLLVLERAPDTSAYDFTLRLLTREDPGYDDFARYLTHQNPQHRYGYGPV